MGLCLYFRMYCVFLKDVNTVEKICLTFQNTNVFCVGFIGMLKHG